MDAPIPTPRQDDDEDVHWALSTAGALWARDERVEALKWLRRAAEQASDVNADLRALELFKAAAEVANKVGPLSAPPPKPSAPPPPAPVAEAPKPPPAPPEAAKALPKPAPREAPKPPPPPPSSVQAPSQRTPPPPPPAPSRALPPIGSKPPPPPPPRPGSMYPAPPVPANTAPSVPRVAPSGPAPAPSPRVPSMPNVVPPPSVLQGAAVRPQAPMPPVVAPARAVAITNAKTSAAAQAVVAPKRRRSFTGESRAAAEKSRPEPARPQHRARRRTFEDEATVRQPLNVPLAPVAPVAPAAAPATAHRAAPDPSTIFDDLDEDTRVLQHKPSGGTDDLIDQAFERLRLGRGDAQPAATQPRSPMEADDTLAGATVPHLRDGAHAPAPPSQPTAVQPAPITMADPQRVHQTPPIHDELTSDGPPSGETRVWTQLPDMDGAAPATERPQSVPGVGRGHRGAAPQSGRAGVPANPVPAAEPATTPPTTPAKRLESLPALRVAVLATSVPGEVRLIALDPTDEAPPGAALAVLVPLSPADGDSVTRLFGGLE